MIGSLRGVVVDRLPDGEVVIEVGGVGYRVNALPGSVEGRAGDPVFVHVHTHVREDAIVLYGFGSSAERACFEALIGAHGVGPALALAILSVHPPSRLAEVVEAEDLEALVQVPGVGKKTAARLLIDLRSRLDAALDGRVTSPAVNGARAERAAHADVRAALDGLGYAPDEVRHALRALPDDGDAAELLRAALRELAGAR